MLHLASLARPQPSSAMQSAPAAVTQPKTVALCGDQATSMTPAVPLWKVSSAVLCTHTQARWMLAQQAGLKCSLRQRPGPGLSCKQRARL